jgi:hypothetical protein
VASIVFSTPPKGETSLKNKRRGCASEFYG